LASGGFTTRTHTTSHWIQASSEKVQETSKSSHSRSRSNSPVRCQSGTCRGSGAINPPRSHRRGKQHAVRGCDSPRRPTSSGSGLHVIAVPFYTCGRARNKCRVCVCVCVCVLGLLHATHSHGQRGAFFQLTAHFKSAWCCFSLQSCTRKHVFCKEKRVPFLLIVYLEIRGNDRYLNRKRHRVAGEQRGAISRGRDEVFHAGVGGDQKQR